jgi:Cdc6-like AAA superfamily ATPase
MNHSILNDIDLIITAFDIKNAEQPNRKQHKKANDLAAFFQLKSTEEALVLALIIHGTITFKTINLNEIASRFGKELENYYKYSQIVKDLEEQDYIYSLKNGPMYNYKACNPLLKNLGENRFEPKKESYDTVIDLIKEVDKRFIKKLKRKQLPFDETLEALNEFHHTYSVPFGGLNQIIGSGLDPETVLYVYAMLLADIKNLTCYDLDEELYQIFPVSRYENLKSKLLSGKNILILNNWIQIKEGPYEKVIHPTLKLINTAFNRPIPEDRFLPKYGQVIKPENIQYEALFYPEPIAKQINQFEALVKSGASKKVVRKLDQLGVRSICNPKMLLFGDPGTGKTSYAYQLAKKYKRSLYYIESSRLQSKYHGETELKIKALFDELNSWQKDLRLPGIVLLNEMDGLVPKRFENPGSSMEQAFNSITITMLEQFEQFSKGILIATSNSKHLDSAFERRFNFKIYLKKPREEFLVTIAKSKLEPFEKFGIKINYAEFGKHPISPSQINNIKDKIALEFANHNTTVFDESLRELIREECSMQNVHERVQIGY